MNNLFMLMAQLVQSGGNPTVMLNKMLQQNPQMGQVLNMMQGKSPQELHQIAQRIAAQQGVDLNSVYQQFGVNL